MTPGVRPVAQDARPRVAAVEVRMWFIGLVLMTLWMALELLGCTCFGLTHSLLVAAIATQLRRAGAPRAKVATA